MKQKKINPAIKLLLKTLIIIGVFACVIAFVFTPYRVVGNNMFPFVQDGNLAIFYQLGELTTNDVILYQDNNGNKKIGRVVATAGQIVKFSEDGYEIDGYTPSETNPYSTTATDLTKYPLSIQADTYFVLNDFRADEDDSRKNGTVNSDQIIGKLFFLFRCRDF